MSTATDTKNSKAPPHKNSNNHMEDTAAERAASAVVAGVPKTNPASTSAVADPANAVKSPRGPTDVRVAVIGNVDSGKSTMIGILTSGILDDGRGQARSRIFRHNHERENGRTSCMSQHIMGFNDEKHPVHLPQSSNASAKQKTRAWQAVVQQSDSIITFIDLAGHEKYLKTTIGGLTGCFPDFAMIIVGANMGVSKMTQEHLAVACALDIPIFVVVTKVDMCPEKVLRHTLKNLFKMLRSPMCEKMPKIMKKKKDVTTTLTADPSLKRVCPVFLVSAVTGINIDKLNLHLSKLQPTQTWRVEAQKTAAAIDAAERKTPPPQEAASGDDAENKDGDVNMERDPDLHNADGETVFEIDETFAVRGVGIVLSGTVTSGLITENKSMVLGPFVDGTFKSLVIRSVHAKRGPVKNAVAGESCSVSVRFKNTREKIDRHSIRKGMVLVDEEHIPGPVNEFKAEVLVLHHPTTIKCNYEPVVHCGNIRQTVIIKEMSQESLRSGDRATIRFQFKCRPEFLHKGRTLILREGNTKCLGKVTEILK